MEDRQPCSPAEELYHPTCKEGHASIDLPALWSKDEDEKTRGGQGALSKMQQEIPNDSRHTSNTRTSTHPERKGRTHQDAHHGANRCCLPSH